MGHLVASENLTGVQSRRFLGTRTLGLPGEVGAHFATFGSSHPLEGAAHGVVIEGMLAVLCANVVALFSGAA